MTKFVDAILISLIGAILAMLLFRVVHAVEVTASVPLTASNFWTTYHAYENLICSI